MTLGSSSDWTMIWPRSVTLDAQLLRRLRLPGEQRRFVEGPVAEQLLSLAPRATRPADGRAGAGRGNRGDSGGHAYHPPVTAHQWIGAITCAGHLGLVLLLVLHRVRSPLRIPVVLLALDMFTWNFAELAYSISRVALWHRIDRAASPFTLPLAVHVIAVFVGRARKLRVVIIAAYLAAVPLLFVRGHAWTLWFLTEIVLVTPFTVGMLAVHWRATVDPEERARIRFVVLALLVGTVFGSADLWYDQFALPVRIPQLSNLATLISTAALAMVALRFRLFGEALSARLAIYALAAAASVVLAYIAVFNWFGAGGAVVILGMTTAAFAVVATLREVGFSSALARERTHQLATMGRFSEQLAHDLKNPLAALDGALQFLKRERDRGRTLDAQARYVDLMLDQVMRIRRAIDEYERLGRVDPVLKSVDLNSVVREVVALQPFVRHDSIRVETELAETLPKCRLDPDLFAGALENVLRNAFEAMPNGGVVTVHTERVDSAVMLSVQDQGVGMDVRTLEHALDDFFTTKSQGSGLGLAFVRRVARVHGAEISLTSRPGEGTLFRLDVPVELE